MGSKGYGITQQDMEASRLVFVSVQSAKPRRKVAVPVPDNYTWQDFLQQVQQKLKLSNVESVTLASSGEQITALDDLQDIDELHVTEGQPATAAQPAPGNGHSGPKLDGNGHTSTAGRAESGAMASSSQSPFSPPPQTHPSRGLPPTVPAQMSDRHRGMTAEADLPGPAEPDSESEHNDKYAKRGSSVKRSLQRVMPNAFQPTLPVTTRDAKGSKSGGTSTQPARRRRRRQQILSLRNVLVTLALLGSLGTMLFLYSKVSPN